jgi:ParB family transcriptional regulator, chromosome partitioning protein
MTKTKPKLVLARPVQIPFNKLVLSQANVRRISNGVTIEELAEDIAHRGLLHNLNVRPLLDGAGAETEMFEVPAGGRRYRALEILVKQKRLPKTAEISCNVKDANDPISAEEDSLAENTFREALHPLDEFRAIQDLAAKGLGDDTIAARLKITPAVVKQRKRLAGVSERLLAIYGANEMTLEQLMAFTVSEDHTRQEQVWANVSSGYNDDPRTIRSLLTEDAVEADDRRVLFVGLASYEAAGGAVTRDLFDEDDGGWLQDAVLLDRLVTDKLKSSAETVASEGWKWVSVALNFPFGHNRGLRRLAGEEIELTDKQHADREALRTELEGLEEQYAGAEEFSEEADGRAGEIEQALEAFEDRPLRYDPVEVTRAGVFISLRDDGTLAVERGYVRPEDEAPTADSQGEELEADADTDSSAPGATAPMRAIITIGGTGDEDDEAQEDGIKPLPDRLVSELTAHRTLALQEAVGNHPHIAMTALLHSLCLDFFFHHSSGNCVQAHVRRVYPPIQAADLKESACAQAIDDREAHWKAELPEHQDGLWDYLDQLATDRRMALLAHCVALGINALHEKVGQAGTSGPSAYIIQGRIAHSDVLARAIGLDMTEAGWRPTVDNYLGRVPKLRILEAVREAKGDQSAQLLDHLKKAEMAKEAERLLDGSGWLPEPLRQPAFTHADADQTEEALPAFLAEDAADIAAE